MPYIFWIPNMIKGIFLIYGILEGLGPGCSSSTDVAPRFWPRLYTVLVTLDTMEPAAGFDVALQIFHRKCVVG